jgi:hypothetical protein
MTAVGLLRLLERGERLLGAGYVAALQRLPLATQLSTAS